MDDELRAELEVGIQTVDDLLVAYQAVLEHAHTEEPDIIELTCLASVLHSFYNGVESTLVRITRDIDGGVLEGEQWHRMLLARMTEATSCRPPVLLPASAAALDTYMKFRHFYRHSSSHFLEWAKLRPLVMPLADTWERVRRDLEGFLQTMSERDESRQS